LVVCYHKCILCEYILLCFRTPKSQVRRNGAAAVNDQQPNSPVQKGATSIPEEETPSTGLTGSKKERKSTSSSRFTIYKVNKASRKKREKSSAKKERKATKTLAIVLGKHFCYHFFNQFGLRGFSIYMKIQKQATILAPPQNLGSNRFNPMPRGITGLLCSWGK
jgi:hypothetical protein